MDQVMRNQVSIRFKAKTTILKVKANFKKGQRDLMCRACKNSVET